MADGPSSHPNPGQEPELLVEVKPVAARAFLDTFALPASPDRPDAMSWQARAALGIGIQNLAVRGEPLSEDVNFVDPDSGIAVSAVNVFGTVTVELAHPRSGGIGPRNTLDLSGIPIFLLNNSEQTDGLVVHPASFEGPRATFRDIEGEYQPLLSPHYGSLEVVPAAGPSNLVAVGTSTDGVIAARLTERQPGEYQVSFSAKPQQHHPSDPGSITVEPGSSVFFAFVDKSGQKIDASGGQDEERLGSQGSVQLDDDMSGICSKIFRNIPPGSRLVFMLSPQ